jgi:hypothetical protein
MHALLPGVIARGSLYMAVRELVNIVQTTPNRSGSHIEYMVTGLLQSFTVYRYFIHSLSRVDMCLALWRLRPAASGMNGTFDVS